MVNFSLMILGVNHVQVSCHPLCGQDHFSMCWYNFYLQQPFIHTLVKLDICGDLIVSNIIGLF